MQTAKALKEIRCRTIYQDRILHEKQCATTCIRPIAKGQKKEKWEEDKERDDLPAIINQGQ